MFLTLLWEEGLKYEQMFPHSTFSQEFDGDVPLSPICLFKLFTMVHRVHHGDSVLFSLLLQLCDING